MSLNNNISPCVNCSEKDRKKPRCRKICEYFKEVYHRELKYEKDKKQSPNG